MKINGPEGAEHAFILSSLHLILFFSSVIACNCLLQLLLPITSSPFHPQSMLTLPPAGHLFFTLLLCLTSQIYSIYHPVVYLNKWSLTVDPAHRKAYKNTDLKNTDNLLPSSCVSFRRMLRWCVMWSVAWRTQSLTPPSCSPP